MSKHVHNCQLNRQGDEWELIVRRQLDHPCEEVWNALTQSDELAKWGPFRPSRNLTEVGAVQLTHMNNPQEDARQGFVLALNPPNLLIFQWGDDILRWELQQDGQSTQLTLFHKFSDRRMAPSYAAGWHLCLRGLTGTLAGKNMPLMVGSEVVHYGFRELYAAYENRFGNFNESEGTK